MIEAESSRRERIRALNDHFRSTFVGDRVLLTAGVRSLPRDINACALRAVQSFSDFTEDNDPSGQHDFGSFELAGEKFFWKMTCMKSQESRAPDGEPAVTRVLTIMLAEEY